MKMAMVKNPPEQVEAWWQDYRKTRSENARNRLMENYLHIVKYSAERLHTKLPEEVEVDDLISAGIFGLMDAVAAFDPTRGVKFETYCARASAARSWTSCAPWTGCRAWCAAARTN